MIYVIAGNEPQAYDWINRKLEERIRNGEFPNEIDEYKYVHSPVVLRGIHDPHGIFIGTWRDRKDLKEIVKILFFASMGKNEAIKKLYEDLHNEPAGVAIAAKVLADEIDNEVLRNVMNGQRQHPSWCEDNE